MSTSMPSIRQFFHRDRIEALLACDVGLCSLRIWVNDSQPKSPEELHLSVLIQPREESTGLPLGNPRLVFETVVTMTADSDGCLEGYVPLPTHITPEVAVRCHYRVLANSQRNGCSQRSPI